VTSAVVLINGLPGAGKTTLAGQLREHLGWVLLSKDDLKETLVDLTAGSVPSSAAGAIAMDTIWALAAMIPGPVLVDSWWFRPRDLDFARAGLISARARTSVEVWCDAPADVARHRYVSRRRRAMFEDDQRLHHEWDRWANQAQPLGLGPVERIDTTQDIDVTVTARRITQHLT
jgi:predicted kinase